MEEGLPDGARHYLRHSLATLAYRGGKVLRGSPAAFGTFKAGATSRTPEEILSHICDLFDWALSQARGQEVWRNSPAGNWDDDVKRFFRSLGALDEFLAGPDSLRCPGTRLLQGPIADAFTHVGQLAMLRRLADAPVRGENYFIAEISAGRVGPDQAAPRREFD